MPPINISPSVSYQKLLSDVGTQENEDPRDKRVGSSQQPGPTSGPHLTTGTGGTGDVHNATSLDILVAFNKISDRTTQYLEDMKKCLEDMNKKIEELNKKMSEASKNASDLASKKGGSRGGATDDFERLARENQTLTVQHGDTKIEVNLSFKSPGDKGKDGGFNKDQWSSVSQQISTDVSSIQTQVRTVSSDMQISVQNWQTFSNQLLKGMEQITSSLGRIASSD